MPGFKLLNAVRLSEDLERAVLLIGQQRMERPPITSSAATPKVRSAARL
jgi:hypothetical protein